MYSSLISPLRPSHSFFGWAGGSFALPGEPPGLQKKSKYDVARAKRGRPADPTDRATPGQGEGQLRWPSVAPARWEGRVRQVPVRPRSGSEGRSDSEPWREPAPKGRRPQDPGSIRKSSRGLR